MLDIYNQDFTTLVFSQQFIVPFVGSISRRFTSTCPLTGFQGLTPDTASVEAVCPDVFLLSSRQRTSRGLYSPTQNILTQERDFLPGINAGVSIPSIR